MQEIKSFFQTLHQTANLAHSIREKVIFADEEITWVQFHILEALENSGWNARSIQEFWLCKACSAANLTRLVKLLEESGMISREVDPTDRRKYTLSLTKKWHQTLISIQWKMKDRIACFRSMTQDIDFEEVTRQLLKVQNVLGKYQDGK